MAGGDKGDIPKLTGIYKIFNTYTINGRANIALSVYAACIATYLGFKLKPKSETPKK